MYNKSYIIAHIINIWNLSNKSQKKFYHKVLKVVLEVPENKGLLIEIFTRTFGKLKKKYKQYRLLSMRIN